MNKRIYLYGCNHRSEVVFRKLKDSGVRVTAFVDRSKKGANIINLQELELVDDKDDVCIYICMQNAMQHEIVADMLFRMGFHYIIFLPVSSTYNMQAYKMVALWNKIYEEGIDFVITNGENSAGGMGITEKNFKDIIEAGTNVVTMGNHTWGKKDIFKFINEPKILRPANYPKCVVGKGLGI